MSRMTHRVARHVGYWLMWKALRHGRLTPAGMVRRPRLYRLGSFLYHWGSYRPDLHREDYR